MKSKRNRFLFALFFFAVLIGCSRTPEVTINGPQGFVRRSDQKLHIDTQKQYEQCLAMHAPAKGSAGADEYCRSVLLQSGVPTFGSRFGMGGGVSYLPYAPQGPINPIGGIPTPGMDASQAVVPWSAWHIAQPLSPQDVEDIIGAIEDQEDETCRLRRELGKSCRKGKK